MTAYISRRLLDSAIVLIIISLLIFLAMRLLPGDPIFMVLSREEAGGMSPEKIENLRHEFGLDRPLMVQYFEWMSEVFRGDLGKSIVSEIPVAEYISERAPVTLYLGFIALVISALLGIPAGLISAVRRGTLLDSTVTTIANAGITVPTFWLGFLLVYIFGLKLGILPVFGYTSPFDNFALSTKQLIMPVLCLAIGPMAGLTRQTRSSMLEVIKQDYIRTAWSKGLKERIIILKHALKNCLIPVITLLGMQIRTVFGGAVLVETVFNIPGMGRLVTDGVFSRDYPVVQGITLIMAAIVTISNLAVDISYGWLDPRIKYG